MLTKSKVKALIVFGCLIAMTLTLGQDFIQSIGSHDMFSLLMGSEELNITDKIYGVATLIAGLAAICSGIYLRIMPDED